MSAIRTVPPDVSVGVCAVRLNFISSGTCPCALVIDVVLQAGRQRRFEDETLLLGNMIECGLVGAEILGQHFLRQVGEQIGDGECAVLGKRTVGKGQQEFGAIRLQSLNRMRNARREIPKIAGFDIGDEIMSVVVDRGDARLASEHEGPFCFFMPMQLAHPTGGKTHIDAGNGFGGGQFPRCHLARPAALAHFDMRVGKRVP